MRAGDVIENEVRDIERGQVMQCFEADVRDLGIFWGEGSLIITISKNKMITVRVTASGRNTICVKFWKNHSRSFVENIDVGKRWE